MSFVSKKGKKINTSSNSGLSVHASGYSHFYGCDFVRSVKPCFDNLTCYGCNFVRSVRYCLSDRSDLSDDDVEVATLSTDQASANFEMKYTTPAQYKLKAEIDTLHNKIEQLQNFKTSGFASTENINQLEESRKLLGKKKDQVKKVSAIIRSQNYRSAVSDTMATIAVTSEANAKNLSKSHMKKQAAIRQLHIRTHGYDFRAVVWRWKNSTQVLK